MTTYAATAAAPRRTRRQVVSGDDLVLESKITTPPVPGWAVPRPRINKLIDRGRRWCQLTVVTGPPGAGKTMALALWAATADPGPVAWVTLDDYDNRPKVFWSYVIAALRRAGLAVPGALPAAARGHAVDHAFLLRLASALAAQDPPVTLVVDDLHLLTEPALLEGLDYVLRNVGSGLRLVVSSRVDPRLPLHRYRLAAQLTEIRASDLALSIPEAGRLMAQHHITLSAGSLERLTRRTEGWAAGIRLAAISITTHPDPDQCVKELITEDSAVTGYLVEEVLNTQPPEVRDMLLSTSILERVSAGIATELIGDPKAAGILAAAARSNAFVEPLGRGWYRYHPLFAEMLRLKLRHQYPERIATLHRRAARWHERNGSLTDAVRHAAEAGDWQLAARMVIDGLAIGDIIEPRGSRSLAYEFRSMPHCEARELAPLLVSAAIALSDDRYEPSAASLGIAEDLLEGLPADQEITSRLAAAMVRLAAARRTGDLDGATAAAAHAEVMVNRVAGDKLTRHPAIRAHVLSGRGAVELWSGHLDEAARVLGSAAATATGPGDEYERADCLGNLALVEALRGGLCRAVELAAQAASSVPAGGPPPVQHPNPAAFVALAWAHLERNDLRKVRSGLKQADAALAVRPDKLVAAVTRLVAARGALAEGRARVAARMAAGARCGWPVPPWLREKLSLVESQAYAAAGDIQAAFAATDHPGFDSSPEMAVTFAHACAAAGDRNQARRVLAPALAPAGEVPERARLQAWLVDARLSYDTGDRARGRRSLESALRLGEREQLRLPFVLERTWLWPVLQSDPDLARDHRQLLDPGLISPPMVPAGQATAPQAAPLIVEKLSDRECEVLRCVSGMLSTAEVASEMYISVNTVKTHLRSICRKLAATNRREAVRRARQLDLI
jgi:LuxR family maltose regulon positive regulatory protein